MAPRARRLAWLRYWRSLVWWQGSGCSRSFDPVGEFLKPFVTGPNRIPISTKEDRDEDGQNAVAKSQREEGTDAAVADGRRGAGVGASISLADRFGPQCRLPDGRA